MNGIYNTHIFILCMVHNNNNNSKYMLYSWYKPYTWYILSNRKFRSYSNLTFLLFFKKKGIEKIIVELLYSFFE
jgi:hypothetical protein